MTIKKLLLASFLAVGTMANADELKLSNFITNTTFSGDARLKYATINYDNSTSDSDAATTRLRLNTNTKINDSFSVGTRLTLSNRTLGGAENTVTFNRIFMDYKEKNYSIRAGRMYAPVYVFSDMFMDVDVDGIAYSTKIKNTQLKTGYLILKSEPTSKTSDENTVFYVEGVHNVNIGENKILFSAATFLEDESKSSTSDGLNIMTLGAEYTHKLGGTIDIAQLKGQYIQSDADTSNKGYTLGVSLGTKTLKNKGDYQGSIEYKVAEKNSFLSTSDYLNQKIIKLGATSYIAQNSNLEINYEMIESKEGDTVDKNILSFTLNHSF